MTKISIIMPVYNSENYLAATLECLQNQIFKDFELICINDGSTDNSLKILEEFSKQADFQVKIINQGNQGAGASRNYGFTFASGETAIFLDCDDLFNLDFLDKMYKKYQETHADIVICKYKILSSEGEYFQQELGINDSKLPNKNIFCAYDIPEHIFNFTNHAAWNKLYKTDFIKENNLKFDNTPQTNDTYFTLCSLLTAKKITTTNEALITYRFYHTGSTSSVINNYDFYTMLPFQKLPYHLSQLGLQNKKVKRSFDKDCIATILFTVFLINRNRRKEFIHYIKNNIFLYNSVLLFIIKNLPDWVYTFGIKLEFIIRRIKQANFLCNKIVPN